VPNHCKPNHFIIPDTQCKPGGNWDHLKAAGKYIVAKKPEVIVHLGDHWDLPSIGTHNTKGHIIYEGARLAEDIKAGHEAMNVLLGPLIAYNKKQKKNKKKPYKPRMIFCRGNHEDRLDRLLEQEPYLIGTIASLDIKKYGWEEYSFLEPVTVDGVTYCHYAQGGAMGRPISRAHLISQKKHGSWVVGHQQTLDIYFSAHLNADGKRVQSIICGAYYPHEEGYMKHQGNQHYRGCIMLHEVDEGQFDVMTLSIEYLLEEWA
jgi:hypothetical protein